MTVKHRGKRRYGLLVRACYELGEVAKTGNILTAIREAHVEKVCSRDASKMIR